MFRERHHAHLRPSWGLVAVLVTAVVAVASAQGVHVLFRNLHRVISLMPGHQIKVSGHNWVCSSTGSVKSGVTVGCSSPDFEGGPTLFWTPAQEITVITSGPPSLTTRVHSNRPFMYAFTFRRFEKVTGTVPAETIITLRAGQTLRLAGLPAWTCQFGANGKKFFCSSVGRPSVVLVAGTNALYVLTSRRVASAPTAVRGVRGYSWP
jgi:hypothetical protein